MFFSVTLSLTPVLRKFIKNSRFYCRKKTRFFYTVQFIAEPIKTQLLFFPITTMAQEWTVSAPSCRLCMKAMLTEVECSACQEWCCLECVGHKDANEAEKVRVMCGECSGLQERLKAQFAHIFRSVSPQRLMRTPASVLTTPERSIKHVTGIKNYNAKPFVLVLRRKL